MLGERQVCGSMQPLFNFEYVLLPGADSKRAKDPSSIHDFQYFCRCCSGVDAGLLLKELRLDGSSLGLVFASMGVGSLVSAFFVLPWLRSRFSTDALILIAQGALAGIYLLMAFVHHCVYCLIPMALTGASWTLAASELWVVAQRVIPNSVRGRISALMMVSSQGAMALGGVVWGLGAKKALLFVSSIVAAAAVIAFVSACYGVGFRLCSLASEQC